MGNGIILGSIIFAVAAMMMVSIMPAMAQPIDFDSNVPQTDNIPPAGCLALIAAQAAAGSEQAKAAIGAIIVANCL